MARVIELLTSDTSWLPDDRLPLSGNAYPWKKEKLVQQTGVRWLEATDLYERC
jgi:hypothetical protein